ncbi:DUF4279 domain-containing protein [Kitasatospora sp. NPDC096147]|uniref:DUF4279 domain-containing protein n=1 Tax=Kitasatospora sp. NPDC096147 TaxID=3364093 RepID=UPI00380FC99D
MPLQQYVYFALFSRTVPARAMTADLGLDPDESSVRGSRCAAPRPVPVEHRWQIECREPGLTVDEQIACVLDRLRPHTDRIADLADRLADDGEGGAVLQVVRSFHSVAPARPETGDAPAPYGWHLDRSVLDFLAATGAELGVDEYDLTDDDEE